MDLRNVSWGGVEWVQLVQDRKSWRDILNAAMHFWVLSPRSYLVSYKFLFSFVMLL
jgi:hypothetical protein